MNTLSRVAFILAAFITISITSSCATLTNDIEVESHANPDINYDSYKTYAWAGSAQIIFDPVGQWEQPTVDMDEEVKFVINRELRNYGIYPVEKDPDLLVGFAAGIDTTVLELKEDPNSAKKVLTNVPKASLLIALTDANTGYIVWLGFAVGDVQEQQSEENIRTRIDYAVSEIFKPYNK
jgi:hypothetical protein